MTLYDTVSHKILIKTIGEWNDHILGLYKCNYPVDDCNYSCYLDFIITEFVNLSVWIQHFAKCSFQIVFA